MTPLVFRQVEVDGRRIDVSIDRGRIAAAAPSLPIPRSAEVIDGWGGALLPGLWDHHIHLVALAAARRSVFAGPPDVTTLEKFADLLRNARSPEARPWIRAVGYHESVAGLMDRDLLDGIVDDVPVRVQHRSGAMWVFNSAAIDLLALDRLSYPGLERDINGRATGRLFGGDRWLRERIAAAGLREPKPELSTVGRELVRFGVTGVTDATPQLHVGDLDLLAHAVTIGTLPQRVMVMCAPPLLESECPQPLQPGPVKVLLADHALPSLDQVAGWIDAAHCNARPIAIHCVTRVSLVLALTALDVAGVHPGDRIEHGAVIPPELISQLSLKGLTVVTQPNFVAERGDEYLTDVDPDDRPHLWPCRTLLDAGVAVAGSTDAPFGHPDPWRAITAASDRRTRSGQILGSRERIPTAQALALFLGSAGDPGGAPRSVAPGRVADLCLLDAPLSIALGEPAAERVRMTIIAGNIVHTV